MKSLDLIEYYERHLKGLADEETYDTEALLVLIARDDLEDQWMTLTADQRQRVLILDDILAAQHQRAASVLPNSHSTDRRRWWWFLNEGPQVRTEALAAGKRPLA